MGSRRIERVYTPYYLWECYLNDMYSKSMHDDKINSCIEFMRNTKIFSESMNKVILKWSNTMLNHMTNTSINRVAFLGQCAVCFELGYNENVTKKAWSFLSNKEKNMANNEASKNIKIWENQYNIKLRNTYTHGRKDAIKTEYQTKLHLD